MSTNKQTPLYSFHLKHNARMVPFAGWEMPVQYSGIIDEHEAVRTTAGLFDVSHMGEAKVHGPDAERFLDYVCTNRLAKLKPGRAKYTVICDENGGCVDDVIIYRFDANTFLICLNASNASKDIEWLQKHVSDYDCQVEDLSDAYAQLALQGPQSIAIFKKICSLELDQMKPFDFAPSAIDGHEIIVAATGYTGERGCEIYCKPDAAEAIAEKIHDAGKPLGLKLAGLGARDSLRLEMGYPLYGHEISATISPLQAGLKWAVKLDKENFIGKAALQIQADKGYPEKIICFKMSDKRIAREGTELVDSEGHTIGKVVSGTHSPTLGHPIGSALIRSDISADSLAARIRNKDYPLDIVATPFVKNTSLS